MSKPIFIIRFPYTEENKGYLLDQVNKVTNHLTDYHVLPVMDSYTSEMKFECFNAPHTEMEFEELKRRVLGLIKN